MAPFHAEIRPERKIVARPRSERRNAPLMGVRLRSGGSAWPLRAAPSCPHSPARRPCRPRRCQNPIRPRRPATPTGGVERMVEAGGRLGARGAGRARAVAHCSRVARGRVRRLGRFGQRLTQTGTTPGAKRSAKARSSLGKAAARGDPASGRRRLHLDCSVKDVPFMVSSSALSPSRPRGSHPVSLTLTAWFLTALVTLGAMAIGCGGETASSETESLATSHAAADGAADSSIPSTDPSAQCSWPAYLDEGGPGACGVGRAFVECQYPVGVTCEGETSVSGGGSGPSGSTTGITQLCLSDDPTTCSGCSSISGTATCTSKCGSNEYAVSCGGPPAPPLPDGGQVAWTYQDPPDGCLSTGPGGPGGGAFFCCPCQ